MAEFNESLQKAAAKPSREAPLSAIETRLRRRHRLRQSVVGVCALALVGVVGGGIALSSDDGPSVRTGLPPAATQAYSTTGGDPPISVVLPEGWVESPPEPGLSLAVGTALQPTGAPFYAPCGPDPEYRDDVFVLFREVTHVEQLSRALNPEEGISSYAKVPYPERPVDFTVARREESTMFPSGDPADGCPILGFRFQDGGRMFEVQVGSGPDAAPERLTEAYAVLNSLVVTPIAIPEPVAPTVPPATVPESADTAAITAAFLGWIDTRPIDASGVYIEDFASIREAVIGAAAANGHPDDYTGRVEAITRIGESDADVIYSFIIDGQPVVANLQGHAVKIDGVWLVSRDTVCDALTYGPVHCPARS